MDNQPSTQILQQQILALQKQVTDLQTAERELRRVKDALKESEEQYRMAFEYTGTAMMVMNEDMTVTLGNHKTEEITGYKQDELTKRRKWTEYIYEQDLPKMIEYYQKRRAGAPEAPSEYEFRLKQKNGAVRDMFINVSMIPGTEKSLISLQDITEQKQVLLQLQESERRFKDIAELLPGIICEIDSRMQITYINKKGLETFGYTREEMAAGFSAFTVFRPEEAGKLERDLYNIFHGDFGNAQEYWLKRKDGSLVYALINAAPVIKNGAPCGMRVCVIDITARKNAELKVKESEECFHNIFRQSPIGIALFDSTGICTEMNQSFCRMFALAQDLQTAFDINARAPIPETVYKRLLDGETVSYEAAHGQASDKRFCQWYVTPMGMVNNKPAQFLAQVEDITERKIAAETALQKAHDSAEKANRQAAGLRKELLGKSTFGSIVSRSPSMKKIFDILPEMAQSSATVLITGESGTGKELIARSLHDLSYRKDKPFIAINCSALPDNLLESELFGYKAGAFTDAKKDKPGKFTLAEGGTLFLDEIGDISMAMQVKLLRVLQQKTFEPLGDTRSHTADVRIIAATNKDLPELIKDGKFREDFFYRINVLTVPLPPLRQRPSDIPLLCEHFIDRFNTRYNKFVKEIEAEALDALCAFEYPGNIRQLENILERAFVFCKGDTLELIHFPPEIHTANFGDNTDMPIAEAGNLIELEKQYLTMMLAANNGNKIKTAERIGIHKATLFRKLKKFGLDN